MATPELLAPAGNMQALKQAIHHGADAVYLGGNAFGARALAQNFDAVALADAIAYAHLYGKKVYVTANTLIYQKSVTRFLDYMATLNRIGADAVIVQDMGMAAVINARFPLLPLHASTQMHNHSYGAVRFAKGLGTRRVVLAREMDVASIKTLDDLGIETEVFIHGALCIAYSGQCLFSALTKGRSGNQGVCAQNCRMRYNLLKKQGNAYTKQQTNGDYLLSPKDLGTLTGIGQLIDAGINSFKIEGRMKSPEYVGFVTALYRKLIDAHLAGKAPELANRDLDTLARLFNRGFTQGFVLGQFGADMMHSKRPNHAGVLAGQVVKINRDKLTVHLTGTLNQGDGIKFDVADTGMIAEKIYKNGLLVSAAYAGDTVMLDNKVKLNQPDKLLITQDKKLNQQLQQFEEIKVPVVLEVDAIVGQPLTGKITDGKHSITIKGDAVEKAKTAPISRADIEAQMARMGSTAFVLKTINCTCSDDAFVPKSTLNSLRRALTEALAKKRCSAPRRITTDLAMADIFGTPPVQKANGGFSVMVRDSAQLNTALDYPFVRIYTTNATLYKAQSDKINNLYYAPPRAGSNALAAKNLLATETGALQSAAQNMVCDYTLNALNAAAVAKLLTFRASCITLSPELKPSDVEALVKAYMAAFKQPAPLEKIVYGRFELMLTKNCIIASALNQPKQCDLCRQDQYYLQDLNGHVYPIKTDENCHNRIFAATDTDELDDIALYKSVGVTSFRLSLLDEDQAACRALFNRLPF